MLSSLWFQERRLDGLTNRDEPFMYKLFFLIFITFFMKPNGSTYGSRQRMTSRQTPSLCLVGPARLGRDASWQAVDVRSTMSCKQSPSATYVQWPFLAYMYERLVKQTPGRNQLLDPSAHNQFFVSTNHAFDIRSATLRIMLLPKSRSPSVHSVLHTSSNSLFSPPP